MSFKGIEHIGLVVTDALSMANWYQQNLGFAILNHFPTDNGYAAFIKCSYSNLIFELLTIDGVAGIEKDLNHHLKLHIAIKSDEPESDIKRLTTAGAKFEIDCEPPKEEDTVCVLKDPWGNRIQLTKRDSNFYS